MRIGNLLLIVVLVGGLLVGATVFALRDAPSPAPAPTDNLDLLILQLADGNVEVARRAEAALRRRGEEALGHLERAGRSADPALSIRARKLVEEMTAAPRSVP
jgi:hypothetical protein